MSPGLVGRLGGLKLALIKEIPDLARMGRDPERPWPRVLRELVALMGDVGSPRSEGSDPPPGPELRKEGGVCGRA